VHGLMDKKHLFQEILPGQLMCLDFEAVAVRALDSFKKMYIMAAFLPYSRYLYGSFSSEPLTDVSLIQLLDECFEHIGGVPEVLELNKEKLLLATKYSINVLTTKDFKNFAWKRGFVMKFNSKTTTHFMQTLISKYTERTVYWKDWMWQGGFYSWLHEHNNKPQRLNAKVIPVKRLELEQPFFQPIELIN
jgi:hypothetical protein